MMKIPAPLIDARFLSFEWHDSSDTVIFDWQNACDCEWNGKSPFVHSHCPDWLCLCFKCQKPEKGYRE